MMGACSCLPAKDYRGLKRKAKVRQDGVFILAFIQSWLFVLLTLWARLKKLTEAQLCYCCQICPSLTVVIT